MKWLPIETAPKMREIILWADTSTPEFSNWKMASGFFHDGMEVWIWGGEQVREWGFACPKGWVHWRDFVDARDAGQIGRGCGEFT